MESMKTTREQTALLGPERLAQVAFGTLCQSFAMGILAGTCHEDGFYQQVALELLEEGAAVPAVQNVLQVDLKLVLELLRKDGRKREKTRELVERLIRLELPGPGGGAGKAGMPDTVSLRPAVKQGAGRYQRTGVLRWPVFAAGRDRAAEEKQRPAQMQKKRDQTQRSATAGEAFFLTAGQQTLNALLTAGWKGAVLSSTQILQIQNWVPPVAGAVRGRNRMPFGTVSLCPAVKQEAGRYQRTGVLSRPVSAAGQDSAATEEQHPAQTQKKRDQAQRNAPAGETFFLTAGQQTLDALLAAGWKRAVVPSAPILQIQNWVPPVAGAVRGRNRMPFGTVSLRPAVKQEAGRYQRNGVLSGPVSAADRDSAATEEQHPAQTQKKRDQTQRNAPAGETFFLTAGQQTLDALLAAGWKRAVVPSAPILQIQNWVPPVAGAVRGLNRVPSGQLDLALQKQEVHKETAVQDREATPGGFTAKGSEQVPRNHTLRDRKLLPIREKGPLTPGTAIPLGAKGEAFSSDVAALSGAEDKPLMLNTASSAQIETAGQSSMPGAAVPFGLGGAALFARWLWNRERFGVPLTERKELKFSQVISMQSPQLNFAAPISLENGGRPFRVPETEHAEQTQQRLPSRYGQKLPVSVWNSAGFPPPSKWHDLFLPRHIDLRENTPVPGKRDRRAVKRSGQRIFELPNATVPTDNITVPGLEPMEPGHQIFSGTVLRQDVQDRTLTELWEDRTGHHVKSRRSGLPQQAEEFQLTEHQLPDTFQAGAFHGVLNGQTAENHFDFAETVQKLSPMGTVEGEKTFFPPEETVLRIEQGTEKALSSQTEGLQRAVEIPQGRVGTDGALPPVAGERADGKVPPQRGNIQVNEVKTEKLKGEEAAEGKAMPQRRIIETAAERQTAEQTDAARQVRNLLFHSKGFGVLGHLPPGKGSGPISANDSAAFFSNGEKMAEFPAVGEELQHPGSAALFLTQKQGQWSALHRPERTLPLKNAGVRDIRTLAGTKLRPRKTSDQERAVQSAVFRGRMPSHRRSGQIPQEAGETENAPAFQSLIPGAPGILDFEENSARFLSEASSPSGQGLLEGMPEFGAETALLFGAAPAQKAQGSAEGTVSRLGVTPAREVQESAEGTVFRFGVTPSQEVWQLAEETAFRFGVTPSREVQESAEGTVFRFGVTPSREVQGSSEGIVSRFSVTPAREVQESAERTAFRFGVTPAREVQGSSEGIVSRYGVTLVQGTRNVKPNTSGTASKERMPFIPEELTYGPVQVREKADIQPPAHTVEAPAGWNRQLSPNGLNFAAGNPLQSTGGGAITTARKIGALAPAGGEVPKQIEWTAPGLNRRPAEISYRQPEPTPPVPAPTLSDRELRRAADQVYQMIEDRLRQERRRLDL